MPRSAYFICRWRERPARTVTSSADRQVHAQPVAWSVDLEWVSHGHMRNGGEAAFRQAIARLCAGNIARHWMAISSAADARNKERGATFLARKHRPASRLAVMLRASGRGLPRMRAPVVLTTTAADAG